MTLLEILKFTAIFLIIVGIPFAVTAFIMQKRVMNSIRLIKKAPNKLPKRNQKLLPRQINPKDDTYIESIIEIDQLESIIHGFNKVLLNLTYVLAVLSVGAICIAIWTKT